MEKTMMNRLDEIAQEKYGKNYVGLMNKGRIVNGVPSYTSSQKSQIVFEEYKNRHAAAVK
jgi:hypothetical protein